MSEFRLLINGNLGLLDLEIKGLVNIGWEPVGPIVIDADYKKTFFQSMYKKDKQEYPTKDELLLLLEEAREEARKNLAESSAREDKAWTETKGSENIQPEKKKRGPKPKVKYNE